MPVQLASHVPKTASNDGVAAAVKKAIGNALLDVKEAVGEVILTVEREAIVDACRALRDTPGLESRASIIPIGPNGSTFVIACFRSPRIAARSSR